MTFSERLLVAAVCELAGRIYGRVGADRTDCSRFVFAVLRVIFGAAVIDPLRAQVMIYKGQPSYSPIEGVVAAGIADEVLVPVPGRWHICQGWVRDLDSSDPDGHAWLWYEPMAPTLEMPVILQATTTDPPWCKHLLWPDQIRRYKAGVRLAVLRET